MHALPVVALIVVGLIGIAVLYGGHRALYREPAAVAWPFLSGLAPSEHALSRFHARWYVATVVFLAFDVEMLFMYPWTLVVAAEGIGAVTEMFVFLGVLLVAVAWAWREGALRWA